MTVSIKGLPAQYAKFLTAVAGQALVYLQLYGATWHMVPALTGIAVSLGVLAVPNTGKPAPVSPPSPVSPAGTP